MATLLSLLLLACSVSASPFNTESDTEVSTHLLQTESKREDAATTLNNQDWCTRDINATLREMSATLAGLKYEIRDLQRENEVQTAKVRDLELQITEVEKLKTQQEVQAAKARELELEITEVEKLKIQQQAHAGELVTIKARASITENHVDALSRERGKKVAFSASLLAPGTESIGPFHAFTSLVFRRVVTNIGNAYNPNTGLFTAPVRGAYHFEMHIYGHGPHPSGAVLVKNGHRIFIAHEHQPSQAVKASNGVTLFLEVGDVVFLQLWPRATVHDNRHHHTTFSGHLLFLM